MVEVDPASLRAAAKRLHTESDTVDQWPRLAGASVVTGLAGLACAALFTDADTASGRANAVLQARMKGLGELLEVAADKYTGTDTAVADTLFALSELNSGDPREGR